jgi:hypothetical protein
MATEKVVAGQAGAGEFGEMGARRLLVLGGIGLIVAGMIFGDLFAVFVLHQNAARVGGALAGAAQAALAGDAGTVLKEFGAVGGFLENRGTKVDTHVHMIGFGYLALLLAVMQPWVALSEGLKKKLALMLLAGAVALPVGVFLIHYVGLAYSPLAAIGWASIFADAGGGLVIFAAAGSLWGLWRHFGGGAREAVADGLLAARDGAGRVLMAGGVLLVLMGFAHGAWYAAVDLYRHEAADSAILTGMAAGAAARDGAAVQRALGEYGQLQGEKAVNIAAHAHSIEFGLLAILLAFFQPYVRLREIWRRRWAWVLLTGSAMLPVCVLMELKYGLLAGGMADTGGLLVIVALMAMWAGILRYTGEMDAAGGAR